ncbi:MAG: hypothetical protein HYV34_00245 [Candidatus Kerfeldbacteria bacterium]|nr:hypothetical protein [Candidatus Kerfeldbacteria bacterium]
MARQYILGDGKVATDHRGHRLFTSDRDGDPKGRQTVYAETAGGSKKVEGLKFDPKTGRFKR